MQVQFTARHMELTDSLRNHVMSKMEKMKRYIDMISEAQVTLSTEKYRHRAEVSIKGKHSSVTSSEVSDDMYQSIDRVFDKLERQIRKSKERRSSTKRSRSDSLATLPVPGNEDSTDAIDAREILMQEIGNRMIETETIETKPMGVEEALIQFELTQNRFFAFRVPEDGSINVLYRRDDGKLGLIRTT